MTATKSIETALMLPADDKLPDLFRNGEIDMILDRIESEALAIAPDIKTAKGRKEIASLAHKVARSKTALDNAGRDLTEHARKQIDAVNVERRKVRDRLDDLKAKVRKPLDDWETAEETRKTTHRNRLSLFDMTRRDWTASSDELAQLIAEIEAVETGEEWEEFQDLASEAKAEALVKYRADLKAATNREEQERELAHLRAQEQERLRIEQEAAEQRRREEEERLRQERKREQQTALADRLVGYIENCKQGLINGETQPFGVLLYELETRIEPDIAALGEHKTAVDSFRRAAIEHLRAQMEQQKAAEKELIRQEAEERERKRLEEERAMAEAHAEREREIRAEEDRRKKQAEETRQKNAAHRKKVLGVIAKAIAAIPVEDLPEAMLQGKVPHVRVEL